MQIVADKQGFSVRAFQEQWFYCPVVSAVDADGKSDRDDPYAVSYTHLLCDMGK